jgi:hypothetical protein
LRRYTSAERASIGMAVIKINAGKFAAAEAELDVLINANPKLVGHGQRCLT